MANPYSIYECQQCGQYYCGECTEAEQWDRFCSEKCEREDKDSPE